MTSPSTSAHRCRAVSLTELLVALALVVVAASLCFPMVRALGNRRQAVVCTHQLLQIGKAISLYAGERAGKFPPSVGGYYPEEGWGGVWYHPVVPSNPTGLGLSAYLGGPEALFRLSVCPLSRSQTIVAPCVNPIGYPYMVNYHIMPSLPFPVIRASQMAHPSRTLVMADAETGASWALGTPTLLEAGGGWRLVEKHVGKLNALWADGHVSTLRKADLEEANFRYQNLR